MVAVQGIVNILDGENNAGLIRVIGDDIMEVDN